MAWMDQDGAGERLVGDTRMGDCDGCSGYTWVASRRTAIQLVSITLHRQTS